MIGRLGAYGACGCQSNAAGPETLMGSDSYRGFGIPGGYYQSIAPRSPQASMTDPAGRLTFASPPPTVVMAPSMPAGYGYPYGYGKVDSATKCEKFSAELAKAQSGQGSGILGVFGGQGIFGNRESVLQGKIEKWCGKALTEADAMAQADAMFQQAVAAGDTATQEALEQAVAEQTAADSQTEAYAIASIGIATLGLGALIMFTGKKGGRR